MSTLIMSITYCAASVILFGLALYAAIRTITLSRRKVKRTTEFSDELNIKLDCRFN